MRAYELGVYSGKTMLFRFRDSLNLLPGKLRELAKNLCPDLGTKGSIPYDELKDSEVRKTLYYSLGAYSHSFLCSFNALLVDWKCGKHNALLSVLQMKPYQTTTRLPCLCAWTYIAEQGL
ncbi:hypothetical protein V6N13_061543 [Hibiscus sabdariffa]